MWLKTSPDTSGRVKTNRGNIKSKFLRKILELVAGIDKRVRLPIYNSETFTNYFKKNNNSIKVEAPTKDRKVVIYSTCFVNFNKKRT